MRGEGDHGETISKKKLRDWYQISRLILSKFERINQLLVPLRP